MIWRYAYVEDMDNVEFKLLAQPLRAVVCSATTCSSLPITS